MPMPPTKQVKIEELVAQLEQLRTQFGDEMYERARKAILFQIIDKPNGEAFITNAWPDLDIEVIRKEAAEHKAQHGTMPNFNPFANVAPETQAPPQQDSMSDEDRQRYAEESAAGNIPPEQLMFLALKDMMPGLKTQGQLNIFMMAFDALRDTIGAAFNNNEAQLAKGREALNKAIDTAVKSAAITEKLKEVPEDERTPEASAFVGEPSEFHEYDIQLQLLGELERLETAAKLNKWYYTDRREQIDRVTSQELRNKLFDAIRAKRNDLEAKEAN